MREYTDYIRVMLKKGDREKIYKCMEECGIQNMSAYIRKVSINPVIINLDLTDVKEVSRLLRISSNNLNQIAKVANGTGCINPNRIEELQQELKNLCQIHKRILDQLATIS